MTVKGGIQGRFDSDKLERAVKEVITKQGLHECPKPCGMVFDSACSEESWISLMIVAMESGSGEIVKLHCETREKHSKVSNGWSIIP